MAAASFSKLHDVTCKDLILKEMKKLINGLERRINKKMDVFENRVNHIEKTFKKSVDATMKEAKEELKSEVQKTVKEAKTEIRKDLKKVNSEELQKKIEENEWSLNRLEQYGRKWNLRIFGIKDKNEEDAK